MKSMTQEKSPAFRATLLITGCCIGAGMIGFPVVNAVAGFIPSTLAMMLCYFFATGTGLLILEATLWFDKKVNFLSLSRFALGKYGKLVTWCLFLFLFYCLFVAYIDGGGQLFTGLLSTLFHSPVPRFVGILTCVLFIAVSSYGGAKAVSGLGRVFILGLAISYCALISLAFSHINKTQLLHINWGATLATLPILLISFGYQNLVPTLIYYVKKNIRALRIAIFVGNLIPFLIYFLWNLTILGILPQDDSASLAKMTSHTNMVTGLLEKASESQSVLFFANTFSFFALLTPFMANTLAFVDFLKDGFKIASKHTYDLLIYALVLIPPTLLTLFYPHLFLKALGFAGGFADVLLFGMIPALIVWRGRYVKKMEGPYQVAGGKAFLIVIMIISLSIFFLKK
jgi:tyrosine-specific transport protein